MVHDEHFSLFEAMSAVELGDPKLDAGMPAQTDPRSDVSQCIKSNDWLTRMTCCACLQADTLLV